MTYDDWKTEGPPDPCENCDCADEDDALACSCACHDHDDDSKYDRAKDDAMTEDEE